MCNRFIKFIPSEEAFWLMHNKPNAFRLLTHIANTARRTTGHPDGLLIGQCHLESWKKYDLTEKQYRTAKQILVMRGHIRIILTNRNRQKSATGSATNSTIVEICNGTIWDINPEDVGDSIGDRGATEGRPKGDKQEGRRMNKKEEEDKSYARTAPRPRITGAISFDFSSFAFSGITDQDKTDWRVLYPHVDLEVELLKMVTWLKANPSKSGKKLWLKFITNWLSKSNDSSENKKSYRDSNKSKENQPTPTGKFHLGRVLKAGNDG